VRQLKEELDRMLEELKQDKCQSLSVVPANLLAFLETLTKKVISLETKKEETTEPKK